MIISHCSSPLGSGYGGLPSSGQPVGLGNNGNAAGKYGEPKTLFL